MAIGDYLNLAHSQEVRAKLAAGLAVSGSEILQASAVEGPDGGVMVLYALEDKLVSNASVSGAFEIDWLNDTWDLVLTGNTTLSEVNLPSIGKTKVISLYVTGDFAITYPANWTDSIIGTYDGTVLNQIVVEIRSTGKYFVTINQPD
jgi:hypothetical protein